MRRDKTLRIRLNPDEYAVLQELADDTMLPLSTFARILIVKGAKAEIEGGTP